MPKVPVLGVTVDQLAQILRTRLEDARARALGAPAAFKVSGSDEIGALALAICSAAPVCAAAIRQWIAHSLRILADRKG